MCLPVAERRGGGTVVLFHTASISLVRLICKAPVSLPDELILFGWKRAGAVFACVWRSTRVFRQGSWLSRRSLTHHSHLWWWSDFCRRGDFCLHGPNRCFMMSENTKSNLSSGPNHVRRCFEMWIQMISTDSLVSATPQKNKQRTILSAYTSLFLWFTRTCAVTTTTRADRLVQTFDGWTQQPSGSDSSLKLDLPPVWTRSQTHVCNTLPLCSSTYSSTQRWSCFSRRPEAICVLCFVSHAVHPSVKTLRWYLGDCRQWGGAPGCTRAPEASTEEGRQAVSSNITSCLAPSKAKVSGQISLYNRQDQKKKKKTQTQSYPAEQVDTMGALHAGRVCCHVSVGTRPTAPHSVFMLKIESHVINAMNIQEVTSWGQQQQFSLSSELFLWVIVFM